MSKYNYKGIIEAQKKEKIIEEYMCFSSNELVEILIDRDLEIERLNNIINELEKELKDMVTIKTDKYGNTRKITHIDINWLLLKINELKGSDKE